MRIWFGLLLGTAAGIVLGLVLPSSGGDTLGVFSDIAQFIINIGRYVVFPLIFFSAALGIYELWIENKLHKLGLVSLAFVPLTSLATVLIGVFSMVIFRPERIPIIVKEGEVLELPSLVSMAEKVFPSNLFSVFVADSAFLLPVFTAAVLFGLAFHYQRAHAEPSLDLFDSLSRVIYRITHYIIEGMMVGFAVLGGYRVLQIRGASDLDLFVQLLVLLLGVILFMAFVVFPLVLYLVGGKRSPLPWLRGMLGPVLAGLLSGDSYFTLPFLVRFGKDNLYLPRKVGSTVFPLAVMFARAGTAMVIAVSFLVILQSYSSLELVASQFFWVLGASFGVSFLLGGVPGSGALIGLALVSQWYGQGLEEGYLILLPAAPFLVAAGVLLDTLNAGLIAVLSARLTDLEMKPAK